MQHSYFPSSEELSKIRKVHTILSDERNKLSKLKSSAERSKIMGNLRFLKRMVCAEGPKNFEDYYLKLAPKGIQNKLEKALRD